MTEPSLFVPIHVDALYLKANRRAVAAHADFSRLPYPAKTADGSMFDENSGTPWVTSSVSDEPFSDDDAELEAGVHLHWALPDSLTRATHPKGNDGRPDQNRIAFPAVPNRWHVVRRAHGVIQAGWIIESDYIWPAEYPWGRVERADFETTLGAEGAAIWNRLLGAGWLKGTPNAPDAFIAPAQDRLSNDLAPFGSRRADILNTLAEIGAAPSSLVRKLTSFPVDNEVPDGFARHGLPPYRYIGRQRRIGEDWVQSPIDAQQNGPQYMSNGTTGKLTALGYGDPTFAAFYPNCRSVFGLHDPVDGTVRDYTYEVYGWYADTGDDPLANGPSDPAEFSNWLKKTLKWTNPNTIVRPSATVYFGAVSSSGFVPEAAQTAKGTTTSKDALPDAQTATISMGNTATEALSATLAQQMARARHGNNSAERTAEKRKIEDYLQALNLSPDLEHRQLDVGTTFLEQRLEDTFTSVPGGTIWTIRADTTPHAAGDAAARASLVPVDLPRSLANALSVLNMAQTSYEHATASIATLREQLYFDWQRYMRFAYPRDEEALDMQSARDHHDLDISIHHIRTNSLRGLQALIDDTGKLEIILHPDPGNATARLGGGQDQTQAQSTRAAQVVSMVRQLTQALADHIGHLPDVSGKTHLNWRLLTTPAPRFYRPKDPVLLLSQGPLIASDRHGMDHGPDGRDTLPCFILSCATPKESDPKEVDTAAQKIVAKAVEILRSMDQVETAGIGFRNTARPTGHPFHLDWEAEVMPVRQGGNGPSPDSRYSPDFIKTSWRLDEDEVRLSAAAELTKQPNAANAHMLRGRGYFTPHASSVLTQRLNGYVQRRMTEYFSGNNVPKDQQSDGYLTAHYTQVKTWFARQGADQQAMRDGRGLLALSAGAPNGAVFGLAEGGAVAEALLILANQLDPAGLTKAVGLSPDIARSILFTRFGGRFIAASDCVISKAAQTALFTALELAAGLRPALARRMPEFCMYLTGELDKDSLAQTADLSAAQISELPERHEAFTTFIAHSKNVIPDNVLFADDSPYAETPLGRIFHTLASIADLKVMQADAKLAGAAAFSKLLRAAQSNGFFGDLNKDLAFTQEAAPVLGLPSSGPLEQAILRYVNDHLSGTDTTFADDAQLADFVITELRLAQPFQSLAQINAVPMVTAAVIAKLLHAADRHSDYLSVRVTARDKVKALEGETGGTGFAVPALAGHAWVDPILTALEALHQLSLGTAPLAQTMSGFHDALIMRQRRWQLSVSDPIGFLEYRAFSERTVRRAVGQSRFDAMPSGGFQPIRSGDVRLARLRIVDTFGQITDLRANHLITSTSLESDHSRTANLPPRIVQPARLNFRWLDAQMGSEEWLSHPETTPICGWVMLNQLDVRLMIYDAQGAPYGSVDQLGDWHPPPGPDGGVSSPDSIENAALRRLVKWLQRETLRGGTDGQTATFMQSFLQLCTTALGNIAPDSVAAKKAPSLLMGRPMALVRASVSVQTRDPYAVDQSIESFGKEIFGDSSSTHGFEHVKLPVRIGEHLRLNDGVVAFWPEEGAQFRATAWQMPGESALKSAGLDPSTVALLTPLFGQKFEDALALHDAVGQLLSEDADPANAHRIELLCARQPCYAPQSNYVDASDLLTRMGGKQDLNMWVPITTPPRPITVSILMDPRANLHATCGVLPTKCLDIPPDDYVAAMSAINVSFLSAPVLSRRGKVDLKLPREAGWRWTWVSREDGRWIQLPETAKITSQVFTKAFGVTEGLAIWHQLIHARWLLLADGSDDVAAVAPTPATQMPDQSLLRNGRAVSDLGTYSEKADAILRVIELGAQAITTPDYDAHFGEMELIEGWMLLSPADQKELPHLANPASGSDK
jgi:hypothetical protein